VAASDEAGLNARGKLFLIHNNEEETDKTWTISWDLPAKPRGCWITCEYANTTVTLTRKLPETVTRCEMVHHRNVSLAAASWWC
jgi:hypothetical protein